MTPEVCDDSQRRQPLNTRISAAASIGFAWHHYHIAASKRVSGSSSPARMPRRFSDVTLTPKVNSDQSLSQLLT